MSTNEQPQQQQPQTQANDISITKETKLRLIEIVGCKIGRIFKEDLCIEAFENQLSNKTYRIEPVMDEELTLQKDELLLPIAHFNKEIYATFGTPFLMKVKQVS